MGLADIERRLERLVEGFFSKAFRSDVQPAEIARRMLREQEAAKTVSVGAVYSPNLYEVHLSPQDHERLAGLADELSTEFQKLLKDNARDRGWRLPGGIDIAFVADQNQQEGQFEVAALHKSDDSSSSQVMEAELHLAGDDGQVWKLTGHQLTVGRLASCDVVIPDPNASREHARLELREDGWVIVDLDSTNHTFVNGAMIKERTLREGDEIRIGQVVLRYQAPRS